MNIQYEEVSLDEILKHYADGFVVRTGEKIVKTESFVDPHKAKVVFKLFIENKDGSTESRPTSTASR